MSTAPAEHRHDRAARLASLRAALEAGTLRGAQRMINALHPAEIAHLLESLPPAQRELAWELVDRELDGDVLVELSEEVRGELIREMDPHEIVAAAEGLDLDVLPDLLADLPEAVNRQVLRSMDQQDRVRLTTVLGYGEDSAGGLMNTDTVAVRPDVSIGVVLRYLRMRGELPERTDCLFVVDRNDRYLGALPVTRLLTSDEDLTVSALMDSEVDGISLEMSAPEVVRLFEGRDLLSAAVIGPDRRLLGRGQVKGIRALDFKGVSVTIPHKVAVMEYLDKIETVAGRIGAVNTVVNRDGRLIGYNTDWSGAMRALEHAMNRQGKTAVVLGAGGAARAIAFGLREKGADPVILNRTLSRAERLASELECRCGGLELMEKLSFDLVINTTSVGMYPGVDGTPVRKELLKNVLVFDTVYNPLKTRLIREAELNGCPTIIGLDMFINQAALQFELWTGAKPPHDLMKRVATGVLS